MTNKRILQIGLAGLLVILIGGIIYMSIHSVSGPELAQQSNEPKPREPREPITSPRTDGELDPDSGDVIAGGVERPATDVAETDSSSDDAVEDPSKGTELDYGKTPGVAPDANEQVALAVEAIQNGTHPERLTAGVGSPSAEHFDASRFDSGSDEYDEVYRANYLKTPEPGRVWHPAQPGPGVPRIRALMPGYVYADQGEDVTLRVSGQPDQPVTFTSFDLGMFENQLTTITVVANDQGVAEATFQGPPGTADDVSIMAASPVMSGQVRLTVHVIGPNDNKSE